MLWERIRRISHGCPFGSTSSPGTVVLQHAVPDLGRFVHHLPESWLITQIAESGQLVSREVCINQQGPEPCTAEPQRQLDRCDMARFRIRRARHEDHGCWSCRGRLPGDVGDHIVDTAEHRFSSYVPRLPPRRNSGCEVPQPEQ